MLSSPSLAISLVIERDLALGVKLDRNLPRRRDVYLMQPLNDLVASLISSQSASQ